MSAPRRSVLVGAVLVPLSLSLFVVLAVSVPRSGAHTWEDSLLRRLGAAVEHEFLLRFADLGLFGATLGAIVATAFVAGFLVAPGTVRRRSWSVRLSRPPCSSGR